MRISDSHAARAPRRPVTVSTCLFLVVALWSTANSAQPELHVVQIEEDWELVVDQPDANSTAPQVVCSFSPVGNVDSFHATLEINHQNLPNFASGGLQLQLWDGESPLDSRPFNNDSVMDTAGEVVRWTQSIRIHDGRLTFQITNGHSTTWRDFGGTGFLRVRTTTRLTNLDGYNPDVSADHSGVSYAANHVKTLALKEVRAHLSDGQVIKYTANRIVHSQE